jgi:broad specificity phosphatase PhoE
MKLMNFRSLDPALTDQGQVGLSRVSAADRRVWEDFASDPDRCHAEAERILAELAADSREPAYWAFAANPARYRVIEALRDLEFDIWTTYGRPIRTHERALIWQTRDADGRRGIVALAEVLEPPAVCPSSE